MEQYLIKTLENSANGISKLLVIVGSDRRGASYGVFSVSVRAEKMPPELTGSVYALFLVNFIRLVRRSLQIVFVHFFKIRFFGSYFF